MICSECATTTVLTAILQVSLAYCCLARSTLVSSSIYSGTEPFSISGWSFCRLGAFPVTIVCEHWRELKAVTQPVALTHLFFICHRTPDEGALPSLLWISDASTRMCSDAKRCCWNVVHLAELSVAVTFVVITFCVSRRRREMCCGHARLCVCVSSCVSVRGRTPTLLHGPRCNLGAW